MVIINQWLTFLKHYTKKSLLLINKVSQCDIWESHDAYAKSCVAVSTYTFFREKVYNSSSGPQPYREKTDTQKKERNPQSFSGRSICRQKSDCQHSVIDNVLGWQNLPMKEWEE